MSAIFVNKTQNKSVLELLDFSIGTKIQIQSFEFKRRHCNCATSINEIYTLDDFHLPQLYNFFFCLLTLSYRKKTALKTDADPEFKLDFGKVSLNNLRLISFLNILT